MKRGTYLEIICYAIVILFVYAALSKLFMFDLYMYDLSRSPLIGPYATPLSFLLPIGELLVSAMLMAPKTRKLGLYGALVLMAAFTFYVGFILSSDSERPCTCGGLIRQLTWQQHFMLNVFYTLLAVTGLWLIRKDKPGRPHQILKYS